MWNMSTAFTSTRCFICWTDKKKCLFWLTLKSLLILSSFSAEERGNMGVHLKWGLKERDGNKWSLIIYSWPRKVQLIISVECLFPRPSRPKQRTTGMKPGFRSPSEPFFLMKSFTLLATFPSVWLLRGSALRLLCWLAQVQQTLMAQCHFPFLP